MELQPMRRTVIIGPGDALTGRYRDLRRRESKVGDRDFRALLRWIAAWAIWAQTAKVKGLVKRMPIIAHNSHIYFRMRIFRVVTIRLSPSGRRGSLHDHLAWRVADRDRRSSASCELDDGHIVRALIGYVHRFTVAGRGRPVRLFADRDAAHRLVRRGSNKSNSPGPCTTTMPNAEPRG